MAWPKPVVREMWYKLYVKPTLSGSCLGALKILANPGVFEAPHISIPPPYKEPWSDYKLEKTVFATRVAVYESFFASRKEISYVGFKCKPESLHSIWYDSKYAHFFPHITIFVGESLRKARKVYNIIDHYKYGFSFTGHNLELCKGRERSQRQEISIDGDAMTHIFGARFDAVDIRSLTTNQRVSHMHKICEYLSQQSTMKV